MKQETNLINVWIFLLKIVIIICASKQLQPEGQLNAPFKEKQNRLELDIFFIYTTYFLSSGSFIHIYQKKYRSITLFFMEKNIESLFKR